MATRPATTPEAAPKVVGLPSRIRSTVSQPSMPRQPATRVFRKIAAAVPLAASAEPALKPNQPNHSRPDAEQHERQVVRAHGVLFEPDARAEHQRQRQAPRPPRRSRRPVRPRSPARRTWPASPPGAHTQCATTAYTATAQIGTNTIQAENLARSAIAPLTSAAVMIAKASWKVANSSSGTRAVHGVRADAEHAEVRRGRR